MRRAKLKPGKVALISGGGSGHEPLHAGFVGLGMLDAACPGQVFTSPTPDQMIAAAEAVDSGAGVLFIVKNYEGDVMNFEMAAEMAGARDHEGRHRRRRGGRDLDLLDRPARRRRHAGRREDRRRRGREGREPRRRCKALGDRVNARDPLDGRGADAAAPCPPPASRPSRSPRTRWRWASASTASPAAGASSWHPPTPSPTRWSRAIVGDLRRRRRRAAARQRLRRHARDGALPHVPRRPDAAGEARHPRRAARWSATTSPRSRWPAARSP